MKPINYIKNIRAILLKGKLESPKPYMEMYEIETAMMGVLV